MSVFACFASFFQTRSCYVPQVRLKYYTLWPGMCHNASRLKAPFYIKIALILSLSMQLYFVTPSVCYIFACLIFIYSFIFYVIWYISLDFYCRNETP